MPSFAFITGLLLFAATGPQEPWLRLHHQALVLDAHADSLGRVLDLGVDLGKRQADGHLDFRRMREGGLDAQFFSIWVDPAYGEDSLRRGLRMIDALKQQLAQHSRQAELALSAADVRRLAREGRIAALIGVEGGGLILNDLGLLRTLYDLGARYMTLTWSVSHDWADSSGGPERWHGLNDFGREVVREMNRLGMLVDISHASEETFWDVLEVSEDPVIASHSSARALCDHPRNLTDAQIRALASRGGVVLVNFYPAFLDDDYRQRVEEAQRAAKADISALGAAYLDDPLGLSSALEELSVELQSDLPAPGISRIADHIQHIAKIAGVDHVGLGSDFDGVPRLPEGMEDCSQLPLLTRELWQRGFGEQDIRKILGENFLRVFEAVADR
ncbi:MAG: dipeptidase [Acidobacteriota bacterium]